MGLMFDGEVFIHLDILSDMAAYDYTIAFGILCYAIITIAGLRLLYQGHIKNTNAKRYFCFTFLSLGLWNLATMMVVFFNSLPLFIGFMAGFH
jgi:hypothetical protein